MPRLRSGPRAWHALRIKARRILGRWERDCPEWLDGLPPWGTSLLLHGLVLLILAVMIILGGIGDWRNKTELDVFIPPLNQDLTSIKDSDHAGDPFTKEKSPEPPSLVLDPAKQDPIAVNQPALPPSAKLGDEISKTPLPGEPLPKGDDGPGVAEAVGVTAPFSGRQGDAKARLLRREGGTVESERAVTIGLDWIARHQRPDGGWSLDPRAQCHGTPCPPVGALESDTAATGLALIPMLGAGYLHNAPGVHERSLRKGIDWLVANQKDNGDLFVAGKGNTHMYSHAIGAIALCEAYGLSKDQALRKPAQKAINYIAFAQNRRDGGWRYEPGQEGDTSVFGWQVMALRSARLSGLVVPKNVMAGAKFYLDRVMTDKSKAYYPYVLNQPTSPIMTAEALLIRQYMGWPRDHPGLKKGSALVVNDLNKSNARNIYYWYYATQMLHNLQGPSWKAWNPKVRDRLVASQVAGSGCDRGSWSPMAPTADPHGANAGRVFQTSLSILTLEVYYRYLPLYRQGRGEGVEEPSDDEAKERK